MLPVKETSSGRGIGGVKGGSSFLVSVQRQKSKALSLVADEAGSLGMTVVVGGYSVGA